MTGTSGANAGRPRSLGARRPLGALAAAVALAGALAACGSSTTAGTSTTTSTPTSAATSTTTVDTVSSACELISADLSGGPDPTADPVGYALAQVLPLRAIRTPNAGLQHAIVELANAYEKVYASNNSKAANAALATAGKSIDRYCPGAV